MLRTCCLALLLLLTGAGGALAHSSYKVEKVADGVYAAIAQRGSQASSNAFFVVGDNYVVAGGAHLTMTGAADLLSAVASVTKLPLRYYILPHHHRGYTSVDFDLPAGCDVVMSVQTWQDLNSEVRKIDFPVLFYEQNLTLKPGKHLTVILSNVGNAHAEGDTVVYLPESKVLFTSDLVYVHNVGYLGGGHMRNWVMALDYLAQMDVKQVIPGLGPVSPPEVIGQFRDYLKDFLTETLRHLDKGDSLAATKRSFRLGSYRDWDGFKEYTPTNIERAYKDLKANVLK